MVFQDEVALSTSAHGEMSDVTEAVAAVVKESGIATGLAHVFHVGSTGAIGAIEFEPGLRRDLPEWLDRQIPPGRHWRHEETWHDGNGHSHLQATLLGPELTVPVRAGRLRLGTWQQIVHLECDVRARDRSLVVTVTGE